MNDNNAPTSTVPANLNSDNLVNGISDLKFYDQLPIQLQRQLQFAPIKCSSRLVFDFYQLNGLEPTLMLFAALQHKHFPDYRPLKGDSI